MRRIIQRQITTIKIVSVTLTWSEEAEPAEADRQPWARMLPDGDPADVPSDSQPKPDEQPEVKNNQA